MNDIKKTVLRTLLSCFFFLSLNHQAIASVNTKWKTLFNGKNLEGWHNPYPHGEASVKDGMIELVANKKFFLAYDQTFSNFEIKAAIKLPEGKANSGILFRSQKKENGVMFGYQAEVDGSDRCWSGGFYDEGRRGWIHPQKPIENPYNASNWKEDRKNALKRNDWNQYRIRCLADHIQIWVNGIKTTDLKDSIDTEGFIAIQHHGEQGQIYRFRDLKLLEL